MTDEVYDHLKELEVLKIEFMDENEDYHRLNSHIKTVSDDYILIDAPKTEDTLHEIPDNSTINLIFTRRDGVLIAQCMYLGKQAGTQSGIKISYPHDTQILERREYVRVPLKLRAKVVCSYEDNPLKKDVFYVVTRNISASGICFFYENTLEDYEDIQCKIYLDDGIVEPVKVKCNHVYSRKARVKNGIYYLTALTYTFISEEDSARIVKECFKYQISRKHIKEKAIES